MKNISLIFFVILLAKIVFCQPSSETFQPVGNCEGCDAVFEYGDRELNPNDTLPDFDDEGQQLKITGTIYKSDGETPAEGVILYIYHTDQKGIYPTRGDESGWGRRHGYLRGWIKTGKDGKYTFYTLVPVAYPSGSEPKHIHPIILEPSGKYYWLHSFFFKGDPLLDSFKNLPNQPRGGGSCIIDPKIENGILTGYRDIILGKNVDGYE